MNHSLSTNYEKQSIIGTPVPLGRRLAIIASMVLVATLAASAQNMELLQKLAAVKQAVGENKQVMPRPPRKSCAYTVPTDRYRRLQSGHRRNHPAGAD